MTPAAAERRAFATLHRDCSRRETARACGVLRHSADPYHRGIARHTIVAQGLTDFEIEAAGRSVNWSALIVWLVLLVVVAGFWLLAGLAAADGIARAFDRPAGCEFLTAAECGALMEGRE